MCFIMFILRTGIRKTGERNKPDAYRSHEMNQIIIRCPQARVFESENRHIIIMSKNTDLSNSVSIGIISMYNTY